MKLRAVRILIILAINICLLAGAVGISSCPAVESGSTLYDNTKRSESSSVTEAPRSVSPTAGETPGAVDNNSPRPSSSNSSSPLSGININSAYTMGQHKILDSVPGLDSRAAHFFILVDCSASTEDKSLFELYRSLYIYLTDNFFVPGDKITLISFARHARIPDGGIKDLTFDFDKGRADSAFPSVILDDYGTDVNEPVFKTLKYVVENDLKKKIPVVIMRWSDRGTNDLGGQSSNEFYFHDQQEESDYNQYMKYLSGSKQREVLISTPGGGNRLRANLNVWYADNIPDFPSKYNEINRERGRVVGLGKAMRKAEIDTKNDTLNLYWWNYSFRNPNSTASTTGSSSKTTSNYSLLFSNDYEGLYTVVSTRSTSDTKGVTGIDLKNLTKSSDERENELMASVPLADIKSKVDARKGIFYAVVADMGKGTNDTNLIREIPIGAITKSAGSLKTTLLVLALLAFIAFVIIALLPAKHRLTRQGMDNWFLSTMWNSRLPVKCENQYIYSDKHISLAVNSPALADRVLAYITAEPGFMPPLLRSKMKVVPVSGVSVDVANSTDSTLELNATNKIQFTLQDTGNQIIDLELEVMDYNSGIRGRLVAFIISGAAWVVLLVVGLVL